MSELSPGTAEAKDMELAATTSPSLSQGRLRATETAGNCRGASFSQGGLCPAETSRYLHSPLYTLAPGFPLKASA